MRVPALLALAAGLAVATAAAATASKPALRLVDDTPVTLRGVAFRPAERVRITVWMRGGQSSRIARATPAGRFTVRFALASEACVLRASAVGSAGSRAGLKLPPRLCAPAPPAPG
ncbi:MAG: hypothetical protein ACRDN6_05510 [Gaiellaceae bacterium]